MLSAAARNLALLRQERGISQRAAAADLGISQALLSHYENGVREPGLSFICRACDYYHVSTDYLLGRSSIREGASFDPSFLYRNSRERDQYPHKTLARFYFRVLSNAMSIVFDLLGKTGEDQAICSAYQYIGIAIYRIYRHLTRFAPDGITTLIEVEDMDLTVSASEADMILSEVEYLRCLKKRKEEKKPFPAAGYKTLEKNYPDQYRSLFEIIYSGGKRNRSMLEAHQKEILHNMKERNPERK